ncbi:MAG TPA: hypothetical protein VG347_02395 [Verrucomicrobiae bacterium]|nr:hypothetical protein [Verrucomicrobiae bacterium]
MNTYKHTQSGKLIVITMLALAVVMAGIGWFFLKPIWISEPILFISAWLFHSLTIEIIGGELCWRFGPGLISKRVPLADITSAKAVRTNFIEGWGIHLSRFGWLYNVSGRGAVAITTKSGQRFALGTDEPEALCAIIQQNLR